MSFLKELSPSKKVKNVRSKNQQYSFPLPNPWISTTPAFPSLPVLSIFPEKTLKAKGSQEHMHWPQKIHPKEALPPYNNNNNNQEFYSQASWGSLEMKPHEPKNRDKTRAKKKGQNKGR
jgi:hypothetical protein